VAQAPQRCAASNASAPTIQMSYSVAQTIKPRLRRFEP
jgi:hypothetical protein